MRPSQGPEDPRQAAASPAVPSSPFTRRAIATGAVLCLLIGVADPYATAYLQGSMMALDFSTEAAIFLLFVLTACNVALRRLRPAQACGREELAVVYAMLVTACALPTMGLMLYVLPGLTALGYYTTPESGWQELINPYVKSWMVVDEPLAIKYFYEGLPRGMDIPWDPWVKPLAAWGIFLLALYLVMICGAVILRRQWMDHERLVYPLALIPLALIRQDQHPVPPLYRNPLMWVGFAVALAVGSLAGLNHYFPSVPRLVLATSVPVLRNTVALPMALSFTVMAFSYFVNLDIALGLWAFSLLALLEQGVFAILGIQSTEVVSIYGTPESPYLEHQGSGAMLVFVAVGLWTGRAHLLGVWRRAWRRHGADDAGEMLSYRAAVAGLGAGVAVITLWLWLSGIPARWLLLFVAVALAIFLGLTRIVVEGGVAAARSPMIASTFLVSGVGASQLGAEGLVALAYTYIWHGDVRTFVMASCANALKVVEGVRRVRPLFWVLLLAILIAVVSSGVMILHLAYTYGGINLHGWFFDAGPQVPFSFVANKMQNNPPPQVGAWVFRAIGGAVMGALMYLRHHFLWWPFHPLGFAICTVSFIVGRMWFSVFMAWLLKLVILKYGGPHLHARTRFFFMGLILGQFSSEGLWLLVDLYTGSTGNYLGW
ncbi:MAG: DUF6785 family protein [Candidatus Latescibacterota bacterium]